MLPEDVGPQHHDGDSHLHHGDGGRTGSKGDRIAREKARGYAGRPRAAHSVTPMEGDAAVTCTPAARPLLARCRATHRPIGP